LAHKDKIVQLLVKHGVAPEFIARLGEAAQRAGAGDDRERWYRAIAAAIPAGGAIGDGAERVALLGPAGVGKTASLIKLTIFETQRRGGSVGWINMDPRGLAAGDLQRYSRRALRKGVPSERSASGAGAPARLRPGADRHAGGESAQQRRDQGNRPAVSERAGRAPAVAAQRRHQRRRPERVGGEFCAGRPARLVSHQ